MKHTDIQKLRDAGFMIGEQHRKIVNYFQLKEDGVGKFPVIISIIRAP
jgi:hypothetical protein